MLLELPVCISLCALPGERTDVTRVSHDNSCHSDCSSYVWRLCDMRKVWSCRSVEHQLECILDGHELEGLTFQLSLLHPCYVVAFSRSNNPKIKVYSYDKYSTEVRDKDCYYESRKTGCSGGVQSGFPKIVQYAQILTCPT